MDLSRTIVSLSAARHQCDATESTNSFRCIPPRVVFLSVVEGIMRGKDNLSDDVV